jgi:hypothetical protein
MIPVFLEDGYLPKGLRLATEAEVIFRFGTGTSRCWSRTLQLRRWVEFTRDVSARRLFINGGFVTANPDPNNLDTVTWLPANFMTRVSNGNLEAMELETMLLAVN